MITLQIVDSFNNRVISRGLTVHVPRVGDKVDMRKYVPAPTIKEVVWRYEDNGDTTVVVVVA